LLDLRWQSYGQYAEALGAKASAQPGAVTGSGNSRINPDQIGFVRLTSR